METYRKVISCASHKIFNKENYCPYIIVSSATFGSSVPDYPWPAATREQDDGCSIQTSDLNAR